jgi:hypothetical protein
MSHNRAVTLLELLIALGLVGFLVLGFSVADVFVHHQVSNAQRRSVLQNELAVIAEDMAKQLRHAIGSRLTGEWALAYNYIAGSGERRIIIYIDYNSNNPNGRRDAISSGDREIAYRYMPNSHQIVFCPDYLNQPNVYEVMSNRITGFQALSEPFIVGTATNYSIPSAAVPSNFISVVLNGCWDPAQSSYVCGTPENPSVTLRTRINMPSVSVN